MAAFLETLLPRIVHIHVQEALAETDHYVPGTGIIPREDWERVMEGLESVSFSGAMVFEIRPRSPLQTAEAAVEFLEGLEQ